MNVDFIWLAFDEKAVDAAWSELSIKELYYLILKDEFRKKVDFRTTLFHKSQYYLLNNLEKLLKLGAINISLNQYKAYLFKNGLEEFPLSVNEIFFDFQLVSYFTTFRMVDDYALIEKILTILLYSLERLSKGEIWNYHTFNKLDDYILILNRFTEKEIIELATDFAHDDSDFVSTLKRLILNYTEFYNYCRNNKFTPFSYNNFSDLKYWGNLLERKNSRSEEIVRLAFQPIKACAAIQKTSNTSQCPKKQLKKTIKVRQTIDSILKNLSYETDPMIKLKSAELLGNFKDASTVPMLVDLLNEVDPGIKQESIRALNEMNEPSVSDHILKCLHDDSNSVVLSASFALLKLNGEKYLHNILEAFSKGVYQLSILLAFIPEIERAENFLKKLEALNSKNNPLLKREIAFILGQLGGKKSLDLLKNNLSDNQDLELKLYSISSLTRIGGKTILKTFRDKFKLVEGLKAVFLEENLRKELING